MLNMNKCIKEIEQKYDMWADDYNLTPQDIEWLIKQAERVQELGSELNKQIEIGYKFEGEAYDLTKQNKRYIEAILLAYYELGFALDETEIDKTKERILQAKLILRNANVLGEIK